MTNNKATTAGRNARRLSSASEYEQKFKTRHRRPGRPSDDEAGADTGQPVFPRGNVHPLLGRVAERRAFAIVHAENKDRLSELYRKELKVLERRGVEEVAEDVGVKLVSEEEAVG